MDSVLREILREHRYEELGEADCSCGWFGDKKHDDGCYEAWLDHIEEIERKQLVAVVEPIVCLMCAEGNKPVIHANRCWYHEFPAGSELCEAMSPTAFKTKFKRVAAQDDGLREEVPIIHGRAELVAHDAALIQKRDREWALVCAEHDIPALADSSGPIKLDSSALRASVREECADAAMEAFGHNETNLPHSDGCIACAVKQAILALASEKAAPEVAHASYELGTCDALSEPHGFGYTPRYFHLCSNWRPLPKGDAK